jgi:hypothetical protein
MKRTLLAVVCVVLAFIGGFALGRHFPVHHYQRFGDTRFVFDTATGKICDPVSAIPPDDYDKQRKIPHCDSVW